MARKPRDTEVDAYIFIKEHLGKLGWDIRNPDRVHRGQVYTQNECLSHPEIKRLLSLDRPENIVKIDDRTFWVIEAKRSHSLLGKALSEAEDYARRINKSTAIQARFISGVAGNYLDSFLIRTRYWDGSGFVPVKLNGVEASGLLSQPQLGQILRTGHADIEEPTLDEKLFLDTANRINEILHLGAVNPHQRAGVMATLLLSMLSDTGPNIAERSPSILIQDINTRALDVLRRQGKSEFGRYINIALPASPDNHAKFRRALVDTIQELNGLNIRSAMDSGADWLGAFYEVFLKYASWAQDLGIVLTPRHLTRYVAGVMNPEVHDILYDPTCGTGGFLVAALDYVKRKADKRQIDKFKQNCVFGIEQDAAVAALAVVNMIFRGDGKNNIKEGNCFANFLASAAQEGIATAKYVKAQSDNPPVTMVMMNPPFALKSSDEKEFRFVDYALKQMTHGGILFSVLPYSGMVKPGVYKDWRRNSLLARNTLLAVVTFPIDLFYPIGITTVGMFVKKGIPHPREQKVLWIRALNDGFVKSKKRRLPHPKAPNDFAKVKHTLKAFLRNPAHSVAEEPKFQKAAPIDFDDKQLELVAEAYLDQSRPTEKEIVQGLEQSVRECLAYLIKIDRAALRPELLIEPPKKTPISPHGWWTFTADQIFELRRGHFHSLSDLDEGEYPTISRVSTDNGFVGFYDIPEKAKVLPPKTITVSTVSGDAFVQPVPFIATDNVVLCTPRAPYRHLTVESLYFIALAVNLVKWRYSYGRQCYKTKFSRTEVVLPVTQSGELDEAYMSTLVENTPYWHLVKAAFEQC